MDTCWLLQSGNAPIHFPKLNDDEWHMKTMEYLIDNLRNQGDEIEALAAIFGPNAFMLSTSSSCVPGMGDHIGTLRKQKEDITDLKSSEVAFLVDLLRGKAWDDEEMKSLRIMFRVLVDVDLPQDGCVLYLSQCSQIRTRVARLHYLPPLCMEIVLKCDYPSLEPPLVELQAPWLSNALKRKLHSKLDMLWDEQGPGLPIVFSWADSLRDVLYEYCVSDTSGMVELVVQQDSAALMEDTSQNYDRGDTQELTERMEHTVGRLGEEEESMLLDGMVTMLIEYNAARKTQLFLEGTHTCMICYEDNPGTMCTNLQCGHFFCSPCLKSCMELHVHEGNLDAIKCPDPDCQRPLEHYEIQTLVSKSNFERWENLMLQRAIDKMPDASWCPRCQALALEDTEDHSATCPKCFYVFCVFCEQGRHPGTECVGPETKLAMLREKAEGGGHAAVLELRRKEQEYLSLIEMKKLSKPCPRCNMAIERSEGCNKMTCGSCGCFFCYKCGKEIDGYDHFKDGNQCVLFDEAEILRWERRWEEQVGFHQAAMIRHQFMGEFEIGLENGHEENPVVEERPRRRRGVEGCNCPNCGQLNYKIAGNNHIHCWSCTKYFCGRCRMMLQRRGGGHFSGSGCKQHDT